jgi:hypothetical protein
VGDPGVPKEEIVVMGSIHFKKGIQGNCHLQHMTIRQAKYIGVFGCHDPLLRWKMSLWNSCRTDGVWAFGTGVIGRCTNVEVIPLIGAKTTVHHNSTKETSDDYG